jgi:hypothetical protein
LHINAETQITQLWLHLQQHYLATATTTTITTAATTASITTTIIHEHGL